MKVNTASVVILVSIILLPCIPAKATEQQIADLNKDFTIQGGHGVGYLIYNKVVLLNATDNLTLNWKTGSIGDASGFFQIIIYVNFPAYNWSNQLTTNSYGSSFIFNSKDGTPPLDLWARSSTSGFSRIEIYSYNDFITQTLNITVNRSINLKQEFHRL